MIKKFVMLTMMLFAFELSRPAIADDNSYGMPAEWLACKDSHDCGKVFGACGHVMTAANISYLNNASGFICKGHKDKERAAACTAGCFQTQPMAKDTTEVFCDNGQCALRSANPSQPTKQ